MPQAKIGVVGVQDGWSTERLREAVARRVGEAPLIAPQRLVLDLEHGGVSCNGFNLREFDALIVKKLGARYSPELLDRLETLLFLNNQGVAVFSRPDRIMRCLDRMACTVMLRLAHIPMPPTVITEDLDRAAEAVTRFGRAVLKPLYTSKARGMTVVDSSADIAGQLAAFRKAGNAVLYVQKMVDHPGRDYGVVFLGGEYVGSYARVGREGSWSTSSSQGGKYGVAAPSDEIIELARRAQQPFELDFTCVDVVETPEGPLVFEVSAFGGFRGLWEAARIDAAELYVDYVLKQVAHAD